jgi:N-carbamoyl-L-amino-acid hydrolase
VNGGWLDGAYGVVSALETVETLHQHRIDLGFDVVGVAFANEEGALFPQAFWGSKALSGSLESVTLPVVDYFGNSLEPILARAGGDIRQLDRAAWDKDSILGYLELHIEQGPVLESAGLSIGIVDSIVGRTVTEVEIMGVPGHAGTTPMEHRRDALATAARIIEFVEELPREPNGCRVATVGRLECFPNSANTISGRVKFTVDLRDANSIRLRQAETRLIGWSRHLARSRGVELRSSALVRSDPASADRGIRDYIAMATRSAGLDFQVMSSGAGHDAQILARITASGMIFVPSIAGVSHVPEENTSETDLVAGARVLFGTVLKIAGDS